MFGSVRFIQERLLALDLLASQDDLILSISLFLPAEPGTDNPWPCGTCWRDSLRIESD